MNLNTEQITIPVGETHMDAFLAWPARAGIYPGIIISAEIFGVTAYIRRVAERVAALGYVVLAPDFYHRTAPGVDLPRDPAVPAPFELVFKSGTTEGVVIRVPSS